MHQYYFAVASKNFLMNKEPIEEILRERANHYRKNNKSIDFWLVTNTSFTKWLNKKNICEKISQPHAAIISLDKKFILWLKLRVSFVIIGDFKSENTLQFHN